MWFLALLAVIGLGRDRRQHRNNKPLVIGIVSLVIIVGTLYVYYHWAILTLAYLLLISAVFINQTAMLSGLYSRVQRQARELADWNETLTQRVEEQVARIEKLDRLRRFLSPQVAELIINAGEETMLASHRRDVTALFCDLRGFTSFSERIEPEEAMNILRTYHRELDRLINKYNGMIDHRAGDDVLVIFNDPVPCEKPMETTLQLALEMRARPRAGAGLEDTGIRPGLWNRHRIEVRHARRHRRGGSVRLHGERQRHQPRLPALRRRPGRPDSAEPARPHAEIEHLVVSESLPPLALKGLQRSVPAFNVVSANPPPK